MSHFFVETKANPSNNLKHGLLAIFILSLAVAKVTKINEFYQADEKFDKIYTLHS